MKRAAPVEHERAVAASDDLDWTPPTRRRRSLTWLIPILAAVVIIALGVVVVVVRDLNRPEPAPMPTREEVAVDYMQALADGRATDALALSAEQQAGPFLTDQALRASLEAAPIEDPQAVGVEGTAVSVEARLGGEPTRFTIPMTGDDETGWQVARAAAAITIAPKPAMIPLLLDGHKVEGPDYDYQVLVFPGVHTMSTESPWLDYRTPRVTLTDLAEPGPVDASAGMTDAAIPGVREAISDRLQNCVARGELSPDGCPWNLTAPEGQPIKPGSVQLSIEGDPLAGFEPPTVHADDALAEGRLTFRLRVEAELDVDGTARDMEQTIDVDTGYTTDLLTEGPDFIWTD